MPKWDFARWNTYLRAHLSLYDAASYIIKMREICESCKLCGGITLPTEMIINTTINYVAK